MTGLFSRGFISESEKVRYISGAVESELDYVAHV